MHPSPDRTACRPPAAIFILILLTACMNLMSPLALCADAAESRQPIPDAAARAVAESSIRELYKSDFAKHAAADRITLAVQLLKVSGETKNDPATKVVLLQQAQDLAVQAGDIDTAFAVIDAEAVSFAVDASQLKVAALGRAAPSAKTPDAARSVAEAALQICDDATSDAHYDAAAQAAAIAVTAAEKSHDKSLIESAKLRSAAAERTHQQSVQSEQAQKVLAQNPDDAAANNAVGRYLCFARGDWEHGLPCLAKGSDAVLADLARRDMEPSPSPETMQALGDAWWQWAEKGGRSDAPAGHLRAAFWYSKGASHVSGLHRALNEKRIAQANAAPGVPQHVISLMPMIDPKRDAIAGEWSMKGRTLVTAGVAKPSELQIRYLPPEEYDFRIKFTRISGGDAIDQIMSHDGKFFMWTMGWFGDTDAYFGLGRNFKAPDPRFYRTTNMLRDGVKHTCVIQVRHDSVSAVLDGKMVVHEESNFADLYMPSQYRIEKAGLGLMTWGSKAEFQSIDLIEITGHGKPLTP